MRSSHFPIDLRKDLISKWLIFIPLHERKAPLQELDSLHFIGRGRCIMVYLRRQYHQHCKQNPCWSSPATIILDCKEWAGWPGSSEPRLLILCQNNYKFLPSNPWEKTNFQVIVPKLTCFFQKINYWTHSYYRLDMSYMPIILMYKSYLAKAAMQSSSAISKL